MNNLDLVELKYYSVAAEDMGINGLLQILDISIFSNKRNNITGILLFKKGHFGQIIEGPRKSIEETWGRIKKDVRHHSIVNLGIREIQGREFPGWDLKLFIDQKFSNAFPQFEEAVGQIGDVDEEVLKALGLLWFPG